jgi:hypothetical protein
VRTEEKGAHVCYCCQEIDSVVLEETFSCHVERPSGTDAPFFFLFSGGI